MGLTISPLPRTKDSRVLRSYGIVDELPVSRLVGVLNLVADYVDLLNPLNWDNRHDIAEIVSRLMISAIDEGAVGPKDAAMMWRLLGMLEQAEHVHRDLARSLQTRLDQHDGLRRAIQHHALYVDRDYHLEL